MVGLFGSLTVPNFVCEISEFFVLKTDVSHINQPIGTIFLLILDLNKCFKCAKFRSFSLFYFGDNGKKTLKPFLFDSKHAVIVSVG